MPQNPSNAQTLISRIFESWKRENFPGVDGGTAFEIFASELALRSYGLTLEEVQSGLVGGGQDGGIDSVYVFFDDALLDEDSEVVSSGSRPSDFSQDRALELWAIQAKQTGSFTETAIDKFENTLRRVLDLNLSLDDLGALYNASVLRHFGVFRDAWEKVLTRRPRINVHVVYVVPADTRGVTTQVEAKRYALKAAIHSAIPDANSVRVELLGDKELLGKYNERPSYTLPMKYQESATSGKSHVALVKLKDYFDLIVDEQGRLRRHLFEWNVRDYQGSVSVNQEIRKSLTDGLSPEFWWLNNGVTIICREATSTAKTYSLSDIQIVNGLQTSHEIFDALRDKPSDAVLDKMLLVRIIVTEDATTRDQVIRATNRQTAITDASLRATDEIQRNIEDYFFTQGWYYDRRKNFYKNDGKDAAKIVSIQFLGAAITAMGLARPDKARGKPSSLLKNNEDYRQVFDSSIDLGVYLWAAKLQRQVDTFILSETAQATVDQKSNLKFHLSMIVVATLNGAQVKNPKQLRVLAQHDTQVEESLVAKLFEDLKAWSASYLARERVILERATKAQKFSEYLLSQVEKANHG